jgi:hypothetical protein
MNIQHKCRRLRELPSGRYFCQIQAKVITSCTDKCPYNKVQKYTIKEGITRFGKKFSIRVKIDE